MARSLVVTRIDHETADTVLDDPHPPRSPGVIAIVLKGYPRLSETFIAQEIRALEEAGLVLHLISLRHPTDVHVHPVHREIRAPVTYLPEYLHQEPARVHGAWRRVRRLPGYPAARRAWLADLARDPSANRIRRFGQALVLVHELPEDVVRLHAHFMHTPASVARYAALILGLPLSISAHARDIWTSPAWEKREKLAQADFTVTCTRYNLDHLAALAPDGAGPVELVYHGLDLSRFGAVDAHRSGRDGSQGEDPVRLLSVGRAVEKKGYATLLESLARLPAELCWTLDHVGGGPLLRALDRQARALGIQDRITWHGALPQEQVLARYRQADVFVLASQVARDGDRDGLPNVLMEAQSQGLACVATRVSAVPELIEDGVTGRLVAPGDPAALAEALRLLARDPDRRRALGEAGETRVRQRFGMQAGIRRLHDRLRQLPRAPAARAA